METLGSKIKKLRIKNKITQTELAEKLFVSDKTISSWECDRTVPEINMLFSISSLFSESLYSLIDTNYCNNVPVEIEIKLHLEKNEFDDLFNKLNNDTLISVNQVDTYYVPTFKEFNNEWLRIREENNKSILTYKKKINDQSCDEYESLFDNKNNLEKILINLGYQEKGKIVKERNKIMYQDKYEISFDYLPNIGYFIEIEVKEVLKNNKEEINDLIELMKKLNIDYNKVSSKRYFDYL